MERKWWHDKIAYQIYPKGFYDSNGDGIGFLSSIIENHDLPSKKLLAALRKDPAYKETFVYGEWSLTWRVSPA